MPCPYLTTVTMVYCRASPVKVYVPSDRVRTPSRCEACWDGCPFYRDAADETAGNFAHFDPTGRQCHAAHRRAERKTP